jgi:hypothetical protein
MWGMASMSNMEETGSELDRIVQGKALLILG